MEMFYCVRMCVYDMRSMMYMGIELAYRGKGDDHSAMAT